MENKINKNKKYFKKILLAIAEKSTCNRKQVSAIIIKNNHIISTGYNGAARGIKHCNCIIYQSHCLRTTHAEINTIISAARHGINIEDTIMICLYKPCYNCMKALINSGIKKCYYFNEYKDDFQKHFEKNKYIKFIKLK